MYLYIENHILKAFSISFSFTINGGEGDLFTAGFTNDNLLLVNSVGSISKLGNIEALVLNLVLALDF